MLYPALVELDPDTDESNGLVHPFCSEKCLLAQLSNTMREANERGFPIGRMMTDSDAHGRGTVCENCLRVLE